MNAKEVAGNRAAEFAQDGMIVGLGTGSTAEFSIRALGKRAAEGLQITAVSTSIASTNLAESLGIRVATLFNAP